jgi:hypothetical protein
MRRFVWAIAAVVSCVAAAAQGGKAVDLKRTLKGAEAAAKAAFARVEGSASFDLRLSPSFPSTWPPTGVSVVHADAARFDPRLSDAEQTAPSWGRAVRRCSAKSAQDLPRASAPIAV